MGANLAADDTYAAFYAEHAGQFVRYLAGMLGTAAEHRGGRVPVADTLQDAMLRAYQHWPELSELDDQERDRQLYRLLRDAAGEALRREHGQRSKGVRRAVVAYDFDSTQHEQPGVSRELTAAVLGTMAREIADTDADQRAVLDRAVLVAGLRALTEHEAVVLIATDYLGWDQIALADRLGVEAARMYETLFTARTLFAGLVRHALDLDLGEEERARLHAYLNDDLKGRERRLARRHFKHCQACQAFARELRVFGRNGQLVLAPLPLVGADTLAKHAIVKSGARVINAGKGLLAQAGAKKALAATAAALTVGMGVAAFASVGYNDEASHPLAPAATSSTSGPLVDRRPLPASAFRQTPATSTSAKTHSSHATAKHHTAAKATSTKTTTTPPPASPTSPTTTTASPSATTQPHAPTSSGSGSSGGGEYFSG